MKNSVKNFFKPIPRRNEDVNVNSGIILEAGSGSGEKRSRVEYDSRDIIGDPGLRIPIDEYDVAIRDKIRREYLLQGPTQPRGHDFPKKKQGDSMRWFKEEWYVKFPWLEYSVEKDAAFCLWCYLFAKGGKKCETFTKTGFSNWKKAIELFNNHVGMVNSNHDLARQRCEDFQNQRQSIPHSMSPQGHNREVNYRIRLTASLHIVRILLKQGLAFRGHRESSCDSSRGNFLELFYWYAERVESVRNVVGPNAPGNSQCTSPLIQKDLVNACASETTLSILKELGEKKFSLLVDESRDKSVKEQMAIILRFLNDKGEVVERFLSIEHVNDTSSSSLKKSIDEVFARNKLSISRLRGQSYDGASNMRGEFNGLKTLILNENPFAFYVHCFAHQLQLVIVAVAKGIPTISDFFNYVGMIVHAVSASCKRRDVLKLKHRESVLKQLEEKEIFPGRGQHQETNLVRPGDTRWGSHHITLFRMKSMWESVLYVLELVAEDGVCMEQRGSACGLIGHMESFHFVFILHLMLKILSITHSFSNALQRGDQNILNAMNLLDVTKELLQKERENGWIPLLEEVTRFCEKQGISVIDMEDHLHVRGRSRRHGQLVTYYHHYHNELFLTMIDLLLVELNDRFSETRTSLLKLISCLDPRDSFARYDNASLMSLASMYSEDFSSFDLERLQYELETFVFDVRKSEDFVGCEDLASLAIKMVKTFKHEVFPLVYRLIELVLILPVATASVERVFSAMNIIKTDLRNRMSDDWMHDMLVCYIEKDVFNSIDDEKILQRFQRMATRRISLPPI